VERGGTAATDNRNAGHAAMLAPNRRGCVTRPPWLC
jgi:hypothetical protein